MFEFTINITNSITIDGLRHELLVLLLKMCPAVPNEFVFGFCSEYSSVITFIAGVRIAVFRPDMMWCSKVWCNLSRIKLCFIRWVCLFICSVILLLMLTVVFGGQIPRLVHVSLIVRCH